MLRSMILFAALGLPATPLFAQDAPPPAAAAPGAAPGSMTLDQYLARSTARMIAADTDGDGRISKAEMAAMGRGGRDPTVMFDRMDTNHDGYLDAAEIKAALTRRFQRMDGNGDGVVTAQERMANRPMGGRRGPGAQAPDGALG